MTGEVIVFAILLAMVGSAFASPIELTHNFRALDTFGAPIQASTSVVVTLYRDADGIDDIWTRTYTPDIQGGYGSLILADGSPTLDTELFAAGDVYVGVAFSGVPQSLPLQRLVHVPYAAVASAVNTDPSPGTSCTSAGELVYDTTASALLVCNGTSWDAVGAASTPAHSRGSVTIGNPAYITQIGTIAENTLGGLATLQTSGAFRYTAVERHAAIITIAGNSSATGTNNTLRIQLQLTRAGGSTEVVSESSAGGFNGNNEIETTFATVLQPGDVITSVGHNYRGQPIAGHYSILATP